MTTRAFSNFSNLPVLKPGGAETKMTTRGARKALGELTLNQNKKSSTLLPCRGKENELPSNCGRTGNAGQGKRKVTRAARRIVLEEKREEHMEVEVKVSEERVLPPGVLDIDSKDLDNPQLCAEYAVETFAYLRELEGRCLVGSEHLKNFPTTDKMRAVLVDWLVEVQIQFKLTQETLYNTVNLIDRFMAVRGKNVHRSRLQLVGVSAMFLAAKIEEVYAPACSDFVYITDNAYTEAEILDMELQIVEACEFNLNQPVPLNFLRRVSKAGDVDIQQHALAKYILEVSLVDYSLVSVKGSDLAAAALCLSLLVLDPSTTPHTVWTPTLLYYSGYTAASVVATARKLAALVVQMNGRSNKLQAVKTKYKSGKFMSVSELPELKGERMLEMAGK